MKQRRHRLGQWGESRAIEYLEERGCRIVTTNWRCQAGEADVVVADGSCLAFVEVRTRHGEAYGSPEESITPRKLARMAAVAECYVYEHGWQGDWRLDVLAIHLDDAGQASIEWYRNVSM